MEKRDDVVNNTRPFALGLRWRGGIRAGAEQMTRYNQDADFEFFLGQRAKLLKEHAGKVVLIHQCEVVDFFDTVAEAVQQGDERFGSEQYAAQTIEPAETSELTSVSFAI